MKCHYEVLQISKDADETEIKTAYRKLALKWHPDKNLSDSEKAKEEFQLVQQAYEILSDRQERAWYDKHREQILRGNDSNFKDEVLDVFPFFTTTCFGGYTDSEKGFYTIYRNVFERISQEDLEFMEDKEEFSNIPSFGISNSDYVEVVAPFYSYWLDYKTKRTYVWLDPHGIKDINRKIFKYYEKENKKIRQKAQKERNDEVRALVAFVRKRDKRVQQYCKKLETKIIENRQKQEEISKQKRLERQKELHNLKSEAEWCKFDNVKMELEDIEKKLAAEFGEVLSADEDEDDSLEMKLDNLYCIACNKIFKTEKSFKNHELSKKHKENVEKLKQNMIADIESLEDNENVSDEIDTEEEINLIENPDLSDEDLIEKSMNHGNIETSVNDVKKQKKKVRKSRNAIDLNAIEVSETDTNAGENAITINLSNDNLKSSETKRQKHKNKKRVSRVENTEQSNIINGFDETHLLNETKTDSFVKREDTLIKTKSKNRQTDTETKIGQGRCCAVCKADFPSKNKLFEHLKKTGHSVYIPETTKKEKKKHIK